MADDYDKRLALLEQESRTINKGLEELKAMITELGKELREAIMPRDVIDERFRATGERIGRLEGRVKAAEQEIDELRNRPTGSPPWVGVLIGLVGTLAGALVSILFQLGRG